MTGRWTTRFIGGRRDARAAALVFSPAGERGLGVPAGSVVTRVTDAAWRSMTTAQFATYHDHDRAGCSYAGCQTLYDTRNTWAPAVTGRIIVETSHALEHGQLNGPQAGMRWIVSGNGTGLYVTDDDEQRPLDFMSPFGGITSQSDGYTPGIIVATGHPRCRA